MYNVSLIGIVTMNPPYIMNIHNIIYYEHILINKYNEYILINIF
jgi:hypothetical protein